MRASVSVGWRSQNVVLAHTIPGVIGGIAALKALKQAGFVPKVPIEAIMFTSEEPTRFGLSCSGSRAIAGREVLGW